MKKQSMLVSPWLLQSPVEVAPAALVGVVGGGGVRVSPS